jgi:hypothetical protein
MSGDGIRLGLTEESAASHCRDIRRRIPGSAHVLAALTALHDFVAEAAVSADRSSPAHRAVLAVILRHAEEARAELLSESAAAIAAALRDQDRPALAKLHRALSRNGFWQAATAAGESLTGTELTTATEWAEAWLKEAKQRGEAASGYPDALDFAGAGIPAEEYAALQDMARCLRGLLATAGMV